LFWANAKMLKNTIKIHEIVASAEGSFTSSLRYGEDWLKETLGDDLFPTQEDPFVTLEITAQMNDDEVLVRGSGEAQLNLCCSRCLEVAPCEEELSFDLLFAPRAKEPKVRAGEILLRTEELDTDFYDGEEIDLDRISAEQLVLALPAYPLCKDDCKGLCPICGKNRNEEACACQPEQTIDPRLAKLANIRLSDDEANKKKA
jgi:uncharacterized protein